MAFEVHYSSESDCLIGTFEGNLNRNSMRPYLAEVVKMANRHVCHRFLNDLRKAIVEFTVTDFYEISMRSVSGEFDRSWKRAIVVVEATSDLAFFETVASNRGLILKVFEDMDEALEWLVS